MAVDEEPELKSALARATFTGVRVMGLRISGYAVGFAASILIARALGPTGRGLYAYPVALLGFVMALAHLGLEFAQIHLAAQGKDLRHMWADATVFSVVAGTVCWAVVAGVVAVDPHVTDGLPLSWIAISMGLVPFLLMSLYWASLLQLDGRLMGATWASWFSVALQAVAIVVLFFVHGLTPFRVLLIQWPTNGSAWLFLLLACHRAGLVNLRVDPALFRRSLAFGVKAYVAQIFFYLVLRVDQVLVAHYDGYRQLGLYALATTVAQLLWLLTDPLAGALMPHMVRARTGDDRRLSFSTSRLSLSILLLAAIGAWFLAPLVVPVVYGAGFAAATPALRLLLPGVVALGATKSLGSMLVKEGRMLITSVLGLSALGLNIALNIVLLPRIGIRGASIASSAAYAALALSYVAISRRRGVAGWRDLVPRPSDLHSLGRGFLSRRVRVPPVATRLRPVRDPMKISGRTAGSATGVRAMGAGAHARIRTAQPPVPRRKPFARLAGTGPVPLRPGYMIAGIGALGLLVLAAAMAEHESTAMIAVVGSTVVFLLALRRISAVALALIPVAVLSSEPLHKTLPATFLASVLALAAVVLFCTGSLRARPPHLCVAVLGVMVLLGYFFPANQLATAGVTRPTLFAVLAGLMLLTVCIAAPPTANAVLGVILVTGAIAGAVASVQGDYVEGRLQGLGLNPNFLAAYLAAPIVISAGLALRRRNPLWLAPGAVCLPALLASQSRAGFLALIAGLAFIIIQGLPRVQKVPIILAAAMVLAAFPGFIASVGAGSRSVTDLTSDNLARSHVALFAVRVALSHPLLGIGLGQFPDYAAASSGFGIYITTTNQYLLLASEDGLITLAAFLVMLWLAFRGPCHGDMALVRAVLVTSAVSLLFTDSFDNSLVALPFWACLGVLLAHRPDHNGMRSAASPGVASGGKEISR